MNFSNSKSDIVKRYEDRNDGYFDVNEISEIVDYYLRRLRTKDARKAVEIGLQLHPDDWELHYQKCRILLDLQEYDSAYAATNEMFELCKSNNEITDIDAMADTILLRGETLVRMGNDKQAKLVFKELLQDMYGKLDDAYLDIADTYITLNDHETALQYLQEGLKYNQGNTSIISEISFCYKQLRQVDKAIEYCNKCLDISPYSSDSWYNLGELYFSKEQYSEAIDAFDFTTAIDDTDVSAWEMKAYALYYNENYRKSAECHLKCARLNGSNDASSLAFAAEAFEKAEDYENGIRYYCEVLKLQPENTDAICGIGLCLFEQKQYEECIVQFKKAIELDGSSSDNWMYLGEAYAALDKVEESISAYNQCLMRKDNQSAVWATLGNLHFETDNLELALHCYNKASEYDPDLLYIDLFLSLTYYGLGKMELAVKHLKIAIAKNANSTDLFLEVYPDAQAFIFTINTNS
ncbi:MAG: tetratricopeptide repeat protein [Bacteroidia bacterium]|nr:tetratricopeptide repeat protein [Bacteroidia bacterium]